MLRLMQLEYDECEQLAATEERQEGGDLQK